MGAEVRGHVYQELVSETEEREGGEDKAHTQAAVEGIGPGLSSFPSSPSSAGPNGRIG